MALVCEINGCVSCVWSVFTGYSSSMFYSSMEESLDFHLDKGALGALGLTARNQSSLAFWM